MFWLTITLILFPLLGFNYTTCSSSDSSINISDVSLLAQAIIDVSGPECKLTTFNLNQLYEGFCNYLGGFRRLSSLHLDNLAIILVEIEEKLTGK